MICDLTTCRFIFFPVCFVFGFLICLCVSVCVCVCLCVCLCNRERDAIAWFPMRGWANYTYILFIYPQFLRTYFACFITFFFIFFFIRLFDCSVTKSVFKRIKCLSERVIIVFLKEFNWVFLPHNVRFVMVWICFVLSVLIKFLHLFSPCLFHIDSEWSIPHNRGLVHILNPYVMSKTFYTFGCEGNWQWKRWADDKRDGSTWVGLAPVFTD